ncbi:phosphoglycerate mutase family protein [Weissella koreensis]|uniref:Phosphoglycerate mutase family protein n=1 Tax=Weissella koreensis TaxID=165096 RepID=A0A7H1MK60_9LACO|nr:phosphoglycerate mutase family protein [Weissella koreensis]AEJ22985.1 phosphoglycerate mutase [Weissella koreensis KACC 15510]AVH74588.1 phosphoglycerate mutase family protein [Weissella koreensis]EJF33937.1 phosphoglycerate mutase [Weissella koreensis KCTC 3621]EJF34227.1 phosphoglycerate mutase [Weissella koreensis KCTC 3621]MCZ9310424.1 phosphoglycerate mutase family protein [Weissella koreensis]
MAKLTLYLVRHGQTYFNIYNKLQGWSNSPLTKNGIQNALDTGRKLAEVKFAAAYSSDTTRAEDTAELILAENHQSNLTKATKSSYFREQFYGSFEGDNMDAVWAKVGAPQHLTSFAEIIESFSIAEAKDMMKLADPFHDAEDQHEYWERIQKGFKLISENHNLQDGDNVLVISHGNTLLSLMELYGKGQFDLKIRPQNGSITKLELDNSKIKVLSYNQ